MTAVRYAFVLATLVLLSFLHFSCAQDGPKAHCESFCHTQKSNCKGDMLGPASTSESCESSCAELLCIYSAYTCEDAADTYYLECSDYCVDDLVNNTKNCPADDRLRECYAANHFDPDKIVEANKCTTK